MKNWRKIGDAASNMVEPARKRKAPPAPGKICDRLMTLVDRAKGGDELNPVDVMDASLMAITYVAAQMPGAGDAQTKRHLSRAAPKIMTWAASLREDVEPIQ
jgi:hypothetical protein